MKRERGFALLAVLWLVTALAALALAGTAAARVAGAVTMNRVALTRARWAAEACLATARAMLDSVVRANQPLAAFDGDTLYFATGARCWSRVVEHDEDGRVNLNAASAPALATLPGFGEEAVRVVLERRAFGERITDLFQVMGRVSPPARAAIMERYGELLRRVEFAPSSLVVTATGVVAGSPVSAAIEVVVVPAGTRAAVVRRRLS